MALATSATACTSGRVQDPCTTDCGTFDLECCRELYDEDEDFVDCAATVGGLSCDLPLNVDEDGAETVLWQFKPCEADGRLDATLSWFTVEGVTVVTWGFDTVGFLTCPEDAGWSVLMDPGVPGVHF